MLKVQMLVVGIMLYFMVYTIKVSIDMTMEELKREFEKDRIALGLTDDEFEEVK